MLFRTQMDQLAQLQRDVVRQIPVFRRDLHRGQPVPLLYVNGRLPHQQPSDLLAGDLARVAIAALFRGRPNRAYHATDDAEMKMGQWFDAIADAHHLPRPPRVSWEEAEARIAPMLLSFMSESRRLSNLRMKRELRARLRYPTPQAMLDEAAPRELRKQMPLSF